MTIGFTSTNYVVTSGMTKVFLNVSVLEGVIHHNITLSISTSDNIQIYCKAYKLVFIINVMIFMTKVVATSCKLESLRKIISWQMT